MFLLAEKKEIIESFKVFKKSKEVIKYLDNSTDLLLKNKISEILKSGPDFLKRHFICPASQTRYEETYLDKIIESIIQKSISEKDLVEITFGKVFSDDEVKQISLFLENKMGVISVNRKVKASSNIFLIIKKVPI